MKVLKEEKNLEKSILKKFFKYVSLNVLGMMGTSFYVLIDTFFISKAEGALGMAALNFSIPVFCVIQGLGLMIGIGGATRYSILKSQKQDREANIVFSTCIKAGIIISFLLVMIGAFASEFLASTLGADMSTLAMTKAYMLTILCFAPFFILNNIIIAFVRNDSNPKLSMAAMLSGSFSNIILDYILMFPFGLGMFGAAFATCLAQIVSIGVLSIHFIKKKNNFKYVYDKGNKSFISDIFSLGLSSFVNEISTSAVFIAFNLVILNLKGNLGVASYGIVANVSIVAISMFIGIAQGVQPLISRFYGLGEYKTVRKVLKFSLLTSVIVAAVIYAGIYFNTHDIIRIFNSEQSAEIAHITESGLKIYFIGFLFAGINIIMSTYLSAMEYAKEGFTISLLRGCVIIVPLVLLLSRVWGMTGVWSSFVLAECIVTMLVIFMAGFRKKVQIKNKIKTKSEVKCINA